MSPAAMLEDLGYLGLFAMMLAETLFPPLPSEAVLPLAGYLADRGEFHLVAVLAASTAGSVLGAAVLYELARRGGRPFAHRFLRFARLEPARLERAEGWFARRGPLVVLVGRCVPGVRSLVSLPAGILRMPRWEYLLYTAIGSLAWNGLLAGAGFLLGHRWEDVSAVVGSVSTPALLVSGLAATAVLGWFVVRRRATPPPRDTARR
jgi:membrane protein DedA with SNARE-associated domain